MFWILQLPTGLAGMDEECDGCYSDLLTRYAYLAYLAYTQHARALGQARQVSILTG